MTKPLYFWNGTTFELVGPTTPQSPFAYQTSAPTAPATGDIWIDSDGDVDTYNRQLTRYYFVATAGQTSVSGTDANGLTLAYVAGSEAVYVNGALQVRGVDYTATNGTSITGLSALALNDVVEVFAYTAFTVANAYTKSETDSVAAAAAGMRLIVPSSVAVGSGTGSANAAGYVTFSGASSVSLNDVFSTTYDNYRIVIQVSSYTGGAISMRMRASGSDTSSTDYTFVRGSANSDTGTWTVAKDLSTATSWVTILGSDVAGTIGSNIEVFAPNLAQRTGITWQGQYTEGSTPNRTSIIIGSGLLRLTTQYTGFSLIPVSSTMTGTVGVYGYKD